MRTEQAVASGCAASSDGCRPTAACSLVGLTAAAAALRPSCRRLQPLPAGKFPRLLARASVIGHATHPGAFGSNAAWGNGTQPCSHGVQQVASVKSRPPSHRCPPVSEPLPLNHKNSTRVLLHRVQPAASLIHSERDLRGEPQGGASGRKGAQAGGRPTLPASRLNQLTAPHAGSLPRLATRDATGGCRPHGPFDLGARPVCSPGEQALHSGRKGAVPPAARPPCCRRLPCFQVSAHRRQKDASHIPCQHWSRASGGQRGQRG